MRVQPTVLEIGEFWSPRNKGKKLKGTLCIRDSGKVTLKTNQLFHGFNETDKIPKIIGCLENGKHIILTDGFYTKFPFINHRANTELYFSTAYLSSEDISRSDLHFNEIEFSYEGIDSWHHANFIEHEFCKEKLKHTLTYDLRESFIFKFDTGIALIIKPWNRFSCDYKKFNLSGDLFFKLVSEKETPLEIFLNHLKEVSLLINFGTEKYNNLFNVIGIQQGEVEQNISNKIEIYFESIFYHTDKQKNDNFNLINFEDLLDNPNFFQNWIKLVNETFPSIQLFLSGTFDKPRYLEVRYLSLVQSLEILQRGLNNDFSSNDTSFEDRIKLLLQPIQKYVGSKTKTQSFLDYVSKTRNELTHTGRLIKIKKDKKYNLYDLIEILESIFKILILSNLNLPDSLIEKALLRTLIEVPLLK
ncbi:TPA: hypothetical protein RU316_002222 [Legionella pneumophila]|nr:hypothetical protein [Legionella pneumophila]HAT9741584.1 hypothetical protein [Legionella pneumophila subsp. pneumophila]HDU8072234.1 hypothetical protein [Legionella pneumophila]HDZ9664784.1 hypothetical protein [Legionella pneumophila]HEL8473707.1 hypothetical protein [Legionella pneumophila]